MADRWSPLISAAAGLTGVWKQRQYDLARRQLEEFLLAVLCPTGGDPRKRRDSRPGQYGGGRGMDRGLCWSDRPRDQQEKLWLVEESTRKQYPVLMAFAELWVGEASPPGRPRGIPRGAADARGGDALLDQDLDRLLEALRRQPA